MSRVQRLRLLLIELVIVAMLAVSVGAPIVVWYFSGPRGWVNLTGPLTSSILLVMGILILRRLWRLRWLPPVTDTSQASQHLPDEPE